MRKVYGLGALQLDPDAGALTHDGRPMALGARAVAVLTALVGRSPEYVPKAEIMDAAWPGLVVEEANLAVQISAIRRALACVPGGEGWIETLARRGYRFAGPVVQLAGRASDSSVPADRKRTNLPQVLTSFIGREKEIAEIKRLLPTTRLLTLTGTGGIGKTRLAVQVAAEVLSAYRDGIWFVDLAPLADPTLVPSALAQVLGVKESPGHTLTDTMCGYLRGKELLLVLDNCEHMLVASASLAAELLRETARVTIVTTSREPLHIDAEQTFPVTVLPLPSPKAGAVNIARSDAVQLFVDRARQHRPRFDLEDQRASAVAQICIRLDGLPLALELAAARIAVLPAEEIVRLLDQRFRLLTSGSRNELPRQQTLRAMIDWSYELLEAAEQKLFAVLSVFAGGWTLDAAKVAGTAQELAGDDVVYLLIALIEKSLVIADEDGDRYRMLETVREYAGEKLTASGSADTVRERHRHYFLALAEEAAPKLTGAEQVEWLQRLEAEHDNLRSALDSSVAAGANVEGLRLCGALPGFWVTRGHFTEGRERCARVLNMSAARQPTRERAKALASAGVLAYFQSDFPATRRLAEECLTIWRELGDRRGMAISLNRLGVLALEEGDFASARTRNEESLAIERELGNLSGIAASLNNLGNVAFEEGEFASAELRYAESLAIARDLGDQIAVATALNNLGTVALEQGNFAGASAMHEESLAIRRALKNRGGIGRSLHNLGIVAFERGEFGAARALHDESLAIMQEIGDTKGIAYSLEELAAVVAAFGNSQRAARVFGAAERLREEIGSPLPPIDRPRYDRRVAAARAALGDDAAFDRAWRDGRELTLEQAVELAQEEAVQR